MNVATTIYIRGELPPVAAHAAAKAYLSVPHMFDGRPIPAEVTGHVNIGCVQIHGTADELRALAKAIEDGAMEIERQDADARAEVAA